MEHIVDISDEEFISLQNHITDKLTLEKGIASVFQVGDSMRLYHPSNKEEALRVQIDKIKENNTSFELYCSLLEWVFQIETELDELLREEEDYLSSFF